MKHALMSLVGLLGLVCPAAALAADPTKFEFTDGDRVVLLGDTLIERDQKYGYLETLITIANPEKTITFRNLGWSGDTVRGTARAFFGTEADGFKHLKEHVLALKPTVILLGYGMADSFDGEAGLPRFESGLNTLLDVLAETHARLVMLSPIAHADLGRPLPDPAPHNKVLARATDIIAKVAASRGTRFIDVFHTWTKYNEDVAQTITDDGVHLTDEGYWLLGVTIAKEMGYLPGPWTVKLHHNGRLGECTGTKVTIDETRPSGVRFRAIDFTLPVPLKRLPMGRILEAKVIDEAHKLVAEDLPDGCYLPFIDGVKFKGRLQFAPRSGGLDDLIGGGRTKSYPGPPAYIWAVGVELLGGPEFDQVEKLRKTINEKNRLYFHRWRPQNETYLFGFRKHEQGNNAREIPLFDPLVEAKEKEIAKLKKPVPHTYELVRQSEEAK